MSAPAVAVVGAGWFARLAAIPALREYDGAELVAVCDSDRSRAVQTAAEFGIPRVFTDVGELISSGVADGVVVAVSQTAHYPVCAAALAGGLHVLVEKPMVLNAAHAWELVERAAAQRLTLMVGETFHFSSVSRRVRDILGAGELGDLLQIAGTFNSHTAALFRGEPALPDGRGGSYADPALSGGGQGHTQVSHLAGLALWCTGESVTEVFGYLDNVGLRVDLVDAIVGRLAGGGSIVLSATGSMPRQHPPRNRLEYYGERGYLIHHLGGSATVYLAGRDPVTIEPASGEPAYPLYAPARQFADLIGGVTRENFGPASSAAACVELLDAAYRSAESGKPEQVARRAIRTG